MFKKPFRVKSQSSMKGSDRKKLRTDIHTSFHGLDADAASSIIPTKDDVTVVKIYTHAGDNAFIYCVNKLPILFQIDRQKLLYPTVYLLWRYPDLVERFSTWPPVFKKLVEGADLMLPGVIVRQQLTPSTFSHVQKGQACSVNIYSNRCPVAVGYTLLSGSDFFHSGMKGKGIHPVHVLGDELWAFGDRSSPPTVQDDPLPIELEEEFEAENGTTQEYAIDDRKVSVDPEHVTESRGDTEGATAESIQVIDGATQEPAKVVVEAGDDGQTDTRVCEVDIGAYGGVDELDVEQLDIQEAAVFREDFTDDPVVLSPEEMDELLQFCFLCAVKSSVKKADLPLPTGTFYKQHVMKYCPADKNLDIKKSTFKKLSKFLQKQSKTGIIKVKGMCKGVDNIVETDRSHPLLRGLEVPEVIIVETPQTSEYCPPQITEMFAVTSNTLPLFKVLGYSKGSALKPADIRTIIAQYVRDNNLQHEHSKIEVVLDPILAEMLLVKAEGDRSTMKWDEIFSRLVNKMSAVFEVVFPGQKSVIRRGAVQPINIEVVQRASNKKATIIENLDLFGIEAKTFAHTVQIKVACSASVVPSQQKNKGPQVVVQGNQINFVAELLTSSYKIPRKYLKGLEKAPRSKRR